MSATCVRACVVCYDKRPIIVVGTPILLSLSRHGQRRRFDASQRRSLREQPFIIMDYPVLGHYDPAVEATDHGSGEEEQELLCE